MANTRSAAVQLRAEIDQYVRDMDRAASATAGVGRAGERAAEQLTRAQKRQVDSAMSVRVAEERLKEVRSQSTATASQVLTAEQNLVRAKDQSREATAAVTKAEANHAKVAAQSSTAMGRLAQNARENREAWSQASVPLLAVGTGVTAMGVAALRTGIQYNTLQQTTRAALTTLTGSTEAANAQMDRLDAFARESPFAKQTFITAQQQLLGFGMEADKVLPTLDAIQNSVAAFGGSNQQISEIAFIFAQIQAAGKITATDLMQLGQRGVDAATLIGSQMGMTGAQIRESITAGTLGADEALAALTAGMDERFGGAADNVKNTFTGAVDRVMAAWRDLSSELAEPFVGTQGGGIFTGLLNESADALRDFQDLPGPVRATGAALGGLVGVSALVGGGFLALAPRIVETREALDTIRDSSPRAAGALNAASTAARLFGIAMAGIVAYQSLDALIPDVAIASLEEFESALLDLAEQGNKGVGALDKLFQQKDSWQSWLTMDLSGQRAELNGLNDAFETLANTPWGDRMISKLSILDDEFSLATKSVDAADAALAKMVAGGNADGAAEAFKEIRRQAEDAGYPVRDLDGLFQQYNTALKGVENEQRATGESAEEMGGAMGESAADVAAAEEAMNKARQAAAETSLGFLAIDAELGEKRGIRDWLKDLEEGAKAQARFTENFTKLTLRGGSEGLLQYIQDQGPAAAQLLNELANGSQEFMDRANEAFGSGAVEAGEFGSAAVDLQSILDRIPDNVQTRLSQVGGDKLINELANLQDAYGLTPDEITTLMRAMDLSSDQIKKVQRLLQQADGDSATVKIFTKDEASAEIRRVRSLVLSIPLVRNIRINTTRSGDDAGNAARAPSANGSLYVEKVKARAAGGLDEYGRGVPRVPQLRNGKQGAVLWGEPETGWEAYISGKPGMEDRNRQILADAADRLGLVVAHRFADGGRLDRLNAERRVRDLRRDLAEKERYGREPKRGQPDRRPRRYVLRGLDRRIAQEELREARSELADLRRPPSQRRAAREQRREDAARAREERRDDISRGTDEFRGNADLSESALSSPAAVERALQRSIADMATFTQLLVQLKRKGAAPWLLQQLQRFGPGKGTIRLARQYLADDAALKRTNALVGDLNTTSKIYGTVTTDKRWGTNKAWSSPLSAAQQQVINRNVNVTVTTDDPHRLARETRRLTEDQLMSMAAGAGL